MVDFGYKILSEKPIQKTSFFTQFKKQKTKTLRQKNKLIKSLKIKTDIGNLIELNQFLTTNLI